MICYIFDLTLYELFGLDDPNNLSNEDKELLRIIKNNPTLREVVSKIVD